jgi:hypothetical protein
MKLFGRKSSTTPLTDTVPYMAEESIATIEARLAAARDGFAHTSRCVGTRCPCSM